MGYNNSSNGDKDKSLFSEFIDKYFLVLNNNRSKNSKEISKIIRTDGNIMTTLEEFICYLDIEKNLILNELELKLKKREQELNVLKIIRNDDSRYRRLKSELQSIHIFFEDLKRDFVYDKNLRKIVYQDQEIPIVQFNCLKALIQRFKDISNDCTTGVFMKFLSNEGFQIEKLLGYGLNRVYKMHGIQYEELRPIKAELTKLKKILTNEFSSKHYKSILDKDMIDEIRIMFFKSIIKNMFPSKIDDFKMEDINELKGFIKNNPTKTDSKRILELVQIERIEKIIQNQILKKENRDETNKKKSIEWGCS